jgi:hypothetical protein
VTGNVAKIRTTGEKSPDGVRRRNTKMRGLGRIGVFRGPSASRIGQLVAGRLETEALISVLWTVLRAGVQIMALNGRSRSNQGRSVSCPVHCGPCRRRDVDKQLEIDPAHAQQLPETAPQLGQCIGRSVMRSEDEAGYLSAPGDSCWLTNMRMRRSTVVCISRSSPKSYWRSSRSSCACPSERSSSLPSANVLATRWA